MKFREPVDAPPPSKNQGGLMGDRLAIWEEVLRLDGKWLPVEFETPREAHVAVECFSHQRRHRGLPVECAVRGNTVFIRQRKESQ